MVLRFNLGLKHVGLVLLVGTGLIVGIHYVRAWSNPTQSPPNGAGMVAATPAGNIGIGTSNPGQKLTVAGTIESTSGGFRFPDGSVQTSAATGGLIPSGYAILAFGTSVCPSGYTKLTGFDTRYIRINNTAGSIGGSLTHNHAMPHTHDMYHTHSVGESGVLTTSTDGAHYHNLLNGTGPGAPAGNGWALVCNAWAYTGPDYFERPYGQTDVAGAHSHTVPSHNHGNTSGPSVANTGQPDTPNTADSNFQPLFVDAIVCVKN